MQYRVNLFLMDICISVLSNERLKFWTAGDKARFSLLCVHLLSDSSRDVVCSILGFSGPKLWELQVSEDISEGSCIS